MKTITKNLLVMTTLGIISASAFSQVNSRDDDRRTRYRERYRDMDICLDIKENLINAEDQYNKFINRLEATDNKISETRRVLRARRTTLENKKTAYETARIQVAELTQLKADKPRLMRANRTKLAEANSKIPSLSSELQKAEKEKKDKCKGVIRFGTRAKNCKKARRALKAAKRALESMQSQKISAQNMIKRLNNVERDLARVSGIMESAGSALAAEEAMLPAISDISTSLTQLINKKEIQLKRFEEIENEYGRIEVRLEKCQKMKYEARKGKKFKKALLIFAENNGEGCDEVRTLLSQAKTRAAKDGINEAYDLYCESDTLVRYVTEEPAAEVAN